MHFRTALIGAPLLLVAACGGKAPETTAALPAPDYPTAVIQPVAVTDARELDGTVEAVQQLTVAAQTSGRVAAILYDVNDPVPAGAVILRIRDTEQRAGLAQAEAAVAEAAARTGEARARYARIADMYQRKVVPRAQFDQITAERDAAVARLSGAQAALDAAREGVAYTEVRAPYASVLTERLVQVGETVSPGTPLISGFARDQLRVVVAIPQSLIGQIRRLGKATVWIDGQAIEASQMTIFPAADPRTSTFRTRVDLPAGTAGLHPGVVVKVSFVTGEASRLLVPRTAVITRSEVTGVYVVGGDNRVSLRQVRLGRVVDTDGQAGRVEVLAGLAAGERVALDPVAAARAAGSAAPSAVSSKES